MVNKRTVIALGTFLLCWQAKAAEVDQFMVLNMNIKDSRAVLNKKINSILANTLEKANSSRRGYSCKKVVKKFARQFGGGTESQFGQYIRDNSESIDQAPGEELPLSSREYYKESIFYPKTANPITHLIRNVRYVQVPLAPVININGVYLGIDKIGHMFRQGYVYMRYYWRHIKHQSGEQMLKNLTKVGISSEKTILGVVGSGVFSYADIEANFQGFNLYRSLCNESEPVLVEQNGKWVQSRAIDLAEYINPDFDEIFNPSGYTEHVSRSIKENMLKYCGDLNKPRVAERMARYRDYFAKNSHSYSFDYLKYRARKGSVPEQLSIYDVCPL